MVAEFSGRGEDGTRGALAPSCTLHRRCRPLFCTVLHLHLGAGAPGCTGTGVSAGWELNARTPRRHARAVTGTQRYIDPPETPRRHRLRNTKI